MRTFMEMVATVKMGAKHTDPVLAVFEQRFEETFKEGAAAQYSLRPYTYLPTVQTRDWILLQSMSVNPSHYGWTLGVHGVPLDSVAPEKLMKFTFHKL